MNPSSRSSAIRAATQRSVKYPSLRATHPRKPLFLWQRNRWFADSLLEETVTSELVSESRKFPASSELAGISCPSGRSSAEILQNERSGSTIYRRFPYACEQGKFC